MVDGLRFFTERDKEIMSAYSHFTTNYSKIQVENKETFQTKKTVKAIYKRSRCVVMIVVRERCIKVIIEKCTGLTGPFLPHGEKVPL